MSGSGTQDFVDRAGFGTQRAEYLPEHEHQRQTQSAGAERCQQGQAAGQKCRRHAAGGTPLPPWDEGELRETSGDVIAREFERYLKRRGQGPFGP